MKHSEKRFTIEASHNHGKVKIKFTDHDIPWYRGLVAETEGEEQEIAKKMLGALRRQEAEITRELTRRFGGATVSIETAHSAARRGFVSACKCHHPPLGHYFGGDKLGAELACSSCGTKFGRHQYDPVPCKRWLNG